MEATASLFFCSFAVLATFSVAVSTSNLFPFASSPVPVPVPVAFTVYISGRNLTFSPGFVFSFPISFP